MTDHRIGLTLYNLSEVMNGQVGKFMDELRMAEKRRAPQRRKRRMTRQELVAHIQTKQSVLCVGLIPT